MLPSSVLTAVHHAEINRHRSSTGGHLKIDHSRFFSYTIPSPIGSIIPLMNDTRNAALPPPRLFVMVSTMGFALYLVPRLCRQTSVNLSTTRGATSPVSSRLIGRCAPLAPAPRAARNGGDARAQAARLQRKHGHARCPVDLCQEGGVRHGAGRGGGMVGNKIPH